MKLRVSPIKRSGSMDYEKHNMTESPEYSVWCSLKQRCDECYSDSYENYGAKGISYDERWTYFSNFLDDMGLKPTRGHQIDRIDNNGHYCKENCRWVTPMVNAANRIRYSECLGAYKRSTGNKYNSAIGVCNHVYHIGTFDTKSEAQNAYKIMFKEWYGFDPIEGVKNDYKIN